ncbi:MAG: metallophosphoesterase [Sedimentisphaerales bacterium]|nr:metallophosphoesterase [Sedimentisphaerales bacterium]
MKKKYFSRLTSAVLVLIILTTGNIVKAQSIIKGPYLQNVTPKSIVIMWESYSRNDKLSCSDGSLKVTRSRLSTGIYLYTAAVSGLNEAKVYNYTVKPYDGDTVSSYFRTALYSSANSSAGSTDFTFTVFGDTHVWDDGTTIENIINSMINYSPAIVLHTGDIEPYDGELGDLQLVFNKTFPLINNTPLFPIRGNHDDENSRDWFSEYFSLPNNEQWYTFSYGDVQFIGLNTNTTNTKQTLWLKKTLEKSSAIWKIVYLHKPPFTAGSHQNYQYAIDNWVPLFQRYGVNIVFSGHTHAYEHYYDNQYCTHYIVAGGGTTNYKTLGNPVLPEYIEQLASQEGISHYCTVDVKLNDITFNVIDTSEYPSIESFDSFTITRN